MISDTSVDVTATNGASFEFYDGAYGLVTMGTTASELTVRKGGSTICTISCPAPTDNGNANDGISVYAFLPAPGQFTNEGVTAGGWGDIYGTDGKVKINETSGGVSLGFFGGYLVYKFATSVQNSNTNPYGADFIVYGNAFWNNSEPGCIQVSQDGETWYDIAGSLYYNESTIRNAHITYDNPNVAEDAAIKTAGSNLGTLAPVTYDGSKSGEITTNPFHKHSWFPLNANYFAGRYGNSELAKVNELPFVSQTLEDGVAKTLTMDGVLLGGITATNDTAAIGFGYCDVHPNTTIGGTVAYNPYQEFSSSDDFKTKTSGTSGGDPIDISWAVDKDGKPVNLNNISYVRVYTGTAAMNGAFGEISTEACGIAACTGTGSGIVTSTPTIVIGEDDITDVATPINIGTGVVFFDLTEEEIPDGTNISVAGVNESNIWLNGAQQSSIQKSAATSALQVIVQKGTDLPYIAVLKFE